MALSPKSRRRLFVFGVVAFVALLAAAIVPTFQPAVESNCRRQRDAERLGLPWPPAPSPSVIVDAPAAAAPAGTP